MSHRLAPPSAWIVLSAALLLAAGCGGGATADATGGTGSTPAALKAVITADVDLDGVNDILEIPFDLGGSVPAEDAQCWRGGPDGLTPAADWREHPGVDAIRRDLAGRTEQDILDDEGAHHAGGPQGLPYAVLHLEAGPDAPGDPVIDALHPQSGRPGALVGLRGTGLAAHADETTVTFDGVDARILLALPRFVLVFVPDTTPLGFVDVVVHRGALTSEPAAFEVVAGAVPAITAVHPDPVIPGVLAVIRGTDLGTPADDVRVTFGGVAASHVLPLGRKIIVEVPAGALSGALIVTVDGVTSDGFPVDVGPRLDAPTLTKVTPASASPGSLVRLEGRDLFVIGQHPTVTFGTARADVFGRTPDGILAIVPAGANGEVAVTVGGRASNSLPFDRIDRGDPTITKITPDAARRGEIVLIEGTDLYDLGSLLTGGGPMGMPLHLPVVTFGTRRAFFAFPTESGVKVLVPFGASIGSVDVVVEHDGHRSSAVPFTIQ